jgi:hypothetical protein
MIFAAYLGDRVPWWMRLSDWSSDALGDPSAQPLTARWLMIEWTGWCVTTTRSRPAGHRGDSGR